MIILIAEDEEICQAVVRATIHTCYPCASIIEVQDGIGVIDTLEAFGRLQIPIDLLILDIHLPGKKGNEVLDYIRKKEEAFGLPRQKVVIMTGYYDQSDPVVKDYDEFLSKPFPPSRLIEIITGLFGVCHGSESSESICP